MKDKKLLTARIVLTALSVSAVCFIFGNSLMNAEESSELSGDVIEFINWILCSLNINIPLDENVLRKAAHFTEFTVLGVLLSVTVYLYVHKRLRSFLTALPIGAVVAVCDELIQTISEGRSCEVRDMLIDISGVLTGALIVMLIITLRIRGKNKKLITEGEKNE